MNLKNKNIMIYSSLIRTETPQSQNITLFNPQNKIIIKLLHVNLWGPNLRFENLEPNDML